MREKIIAGFLCVLLMLSLSGCESKKAEEAQKGKDIEYTVVAERDLPQELVDVIDAKKTEKYKITYTDGEYLYISYGYGEQESGGYSIGVKALYQTPNSLHFAVEVHGPKRGENVPKGKSYPYIVVKTEAVELPVVFE